jgi:HSP20 family protein
MRVRLPTVAFAAALVALLVAPTPARAFNLFPSHWAREETHAEPCSEGARERAELTGTCPDHCGAETCECSATTCPSPLPVDRGAVHGPLGVGTAAAMRRAVDRAVTTARMRLKNLNLHLPSRGSDKEHTPTKKEDATTVSVADILDDLERQLFLASPASLHSVAHHESPLSALARAGHGVLNVFPSLGIPEKAEKRFAEQSRLLRSAMDVHETDEFIEFVADVPGANDDDLEVEVLKKDPNSSSHQELDVLVVRGKRDVLLEEPVEEEDVEKEKRKAEGSKLGTFRVRERHFGAFENRYALPPSVDVDRISAKTSKGVLTVTAPKRPAGPEAVPEPPEPPKREVRRVAVAAE